MKLALGDLHPWVLTVHGGDAISVDVPPMRANVPLPTDGSSRHVLDPEDADALGRLLILAAKLARKTKHG